MGRKSSPPAGSFKELKKTCQITTNLNHIYMGHAEIRFPHGLGHAEIRFLHGPRANLISFHHSATTISRFFLKMYVNLSLVSLPILYWGWSRSSWDDYASLSVHKYFSPYVNMSFLKSCRELHYLLWVSRVLKYPKKCLEHLTMFFMSTWWGDSKNMKDIELSRWLFELPAK